LKFLDPAQPGQIIALPIAEAVIDAPQTLAINYPGFLCSNTPTKTRARFAFQASSWSDSTARQL
jgi:hypothetical protein